ncbi:response regulator [bacterium]|nr:response regulator [bacterium]
MKSKILIVDDQPTMRLLLKITLSGEGYELYEATDGISALEIAQKINPDLIIMDVMMPGMDGYTAIERIKQIPQLRNISFFIITAKDTRIYKEFSQDAGAIYHFTKPFDPGDILQKVNEIFDNNKKTTV